MGRLVTPLVINANATIDEVRALVAHAFAVNARAQDRKGELQAGPPLEWVVVRRTVAFDVRWYLLRLWDMNTMIPDHANGRATFISVVGLEEHQRVGAAQLSDISDDAWRQEAFTLSDETAPTVILTGARVFALIEPQLRSASRGGSRSRGIEALPPTPATLSISRTGEPAVPAERPPTPVRSGAVVPAEEAMRIDAHAYVGAPRQVVQDKNFTLELGLAETSTPNVEGGEVSIAFRPGELSVVLDIRVECEGFHSSGGNDVKLLVPRDDPFTSRVILVLRALPLADGVRDELRALQILYSCNGIACGSATWRMLVQREDAEVAVPPPPAASRVAIDTSTPPIDLTLRSAWKDDSESSHTLQWSFTSPHDLTNPAGKMVRSSPELAALPISIVDEMAQSDAQLGIELLMGGIAKRIADEIPAGVWEVLRSVTDAVRKSRGPAAIPTVLLSTQETRVPWELALMPGPLPDPAREPFLSTQYIVTRWILDDTVRAVPPASITDHDLVAVFGDYSAARGVSVLPYARKEADFIRQKSGTALDATRSSIIQLLTGRATTASGVPLAPGILHFAGHGEAARSGTAASFIVLNDGSSLSTTYFLNAPALKHSHPLVFLNACQLGTATSTMGQPGGFAGVCVRGECSVVIAPLWSVNDEVAYDVAIKFYSDILAGMPVAEAMFHARGKPFTDITYTDASGASQTRTTATRLAYLVYGHPSFRL